MTADGWFGEINLDADDGDGNDTDAGDDTGNGDVATGLVALVVTVIEILLDALQREAIRRMEAGDLSDAEIERVGRTLQAVEAEINRLKSEHGIEAETDRLRDQLDGLVRDALVDIDDRPADTTGGDGTPSRGDRQ